MPTDDAAHFAWAAQQEETMPKQDTLPPRPWRKEPIPHRKDLAILGANGCLIAEVTGPTREAVAALLLRAPQVEQAAREAERALIELWGREDLPDAVNGRLWWIAERLRLALGGEK